MTHLTPREAATEQADMRYALDEMMEEYVGIRRALLEDELRRCSTAPLRSLTN